MSIRVSRRTAPSPGVAVVAVLGLAATAWLVLVLGSHTHEVVGPVEPGTHAHGVEGAPTVSTSGTLTGLGGWTLMVLAMMLPPALPLVALLSGLLVQRARPGVGLGAGLVAFVGVWTAVGIVLVGGDMAVDALTLGGTGRARLAGAAVLLAGVYQFTPVKNACLTACRSPRWFALRFWRGRRPTREAALVGGAYGVSCVGCCWALMLLCLGAGSLALPVMVALTVVMAAERLLPWPVVRRAVPVVGVLLAALGLSLLAGVLPAALIHPVLGA